MGYFRNRWQNQFWRILKQCTWNFSLLFLVLNHCRYRFQAAAPKYQRTTLRYIGSLNSKKKVICLTSSLSEIFAPRLHMFTTSILRLFKVSLTTLFSLTYHPFYVRRNVRRWNIFDSSLTIFVEEWPLQEKLHFICYLFEITFIFVAIVLNSIQIIIIPLDINYL